MPVSIRKLTPEYEESYMRFVMNKKESLMYYSLSFRKFLTELLGDNSEYLIAVSDKGEVIGCMPVFYREDYQYGTVANSLPYYGGHGGPIAENKETIKLLLEKYVDTIKEKRCVASTIIGSPLENYDQLYRDVVKPNYIDERIELMTYFPYDIGLSLEDALMSKYHYKERNSIRKAIKNNVVIKIDNSIEAMDFLCRVHTENIEVVGGLPKKREAFELIQRVFKAGEDYDLFIAKKDNAKIAAVLVFYFNGTVEYYTPAIVQEYRSIQPLALLIYTAMQKGMKMGLEKWNWGGTGLSQKSLYDFKSKWGTTETRYYYYTKIWDHSIMDANQDELMKAFSNYFVYPFGQVNKDE